MTSGTFSRTDRDYILEMLRTRVLDVDFIKADGSHRTMKCTLKTDLLPPPPAKKEFDLTAPVTESKHKAENLDVIAVWDLEAKGWRSFRLESVTCITTRAMAGLANATERV